MKVIYHCYGGSHTSVIVAAIHLGLLPKHRLPTREEILALPHFDQTKGWELGTPFFMGRDPEGHEIYIIGRKSNPRLLVNLVQSLLEIRGLPPEEILLVNALTAATMTILIGGTLSRGLGLVSLGRPLAIMGIQLSYWRFVRLVEETKSRLREITKGAGRSHCS